MRNEKTTKRILGTNYQDSGIDLQGHSGEDLFSGQGTMGKPRNLVERSGR